MALFEDRDCWKAAGQLEEHLDEAPGLVHVRESATTNPFIAVFTMRPASPEYRLQEFKGFPVKVFYVRPAEDGSCLKESLGSSYVGYVRSRSNYIRFTTKEDQGLTLLTSVA